MPDKLNRRDQAAVRMAREGLISPQHLWGTINCDGISPKGEICGVTTTSGLAWKIPGRGEANLYNLSSFLIVEAMRRGASPKDAGLEALRRVAANTIEKRLRNDRGLPAFDLTFYVLNRKGEYTGVSLYAGQYAVCTEKGPETLPTEALFEGHA